MALATLITTIPIYPDRIMDACGKCGSAYVVFSPWPGVIPYTGHCECPDEHGAGPKPGEFVVPQWGG